MLQRLQVIVIVATLSGLAAGLLITGVQSIRVIPLILQAETYEQARALAQGHSEVEAHSQPGGSDVSWAPEDGFERLSYTALFNTLTGIGFALLLNAMLSLRGHSGIWRGALWGLAGFATFTLAPSFGLPPELPGSEAAALAGRQIWWAFTVVATGAGLYAIVFIRKPMFASIGSVLMLLPHVIGAPQPDHHGNLLPEPLVQHFILATLATSLTFWVLLGSVSGALLRRFSMPPNVSAS